MGKNQRASSFTEKFFQYLAETAKELLILGVDVVVDPHQFLPYHKNPRRQGASFSPKAVQHISVRYLREGKDRSGNTMYALNSLGRVRALETLLRQKLQATRRRWNGEWIIVVFDIPEKVRWQRNFLRYELKRLGFLELQKSVWIIPADAERELLALLRLWNVEIEGGDVRMLVARNLYRDEDLRRAFRISMLRETRPK